MLAQSITLLHDVARDPLRMRAHRHRQVVVLYERGLLVHELQLLISADGCRLQPPSVIEVALLAPHALHLPLEVCAPAAVAV